jgi:Fic family protein
MDIRDFKAGTYKKQYEYKSFSPEAVNHEWIITDGKLSTLLSEADRKIGELKAAGRWIADIDYFIRMHIAKEAMTSSRIEGTQTTMEEALANSADILPERKDDWREVNNYITAMNAAEQELRKLPLSNRLLKNTHKMLLAGVRGRQKNPGEFRKSQNWIGPSLKEAAYIPPVHTEAEILMSDLEQFLHNDRIQVAPLLRIAIAHYQFETIHPFLDGNGRLGRLLITLYLVSQNILEKPTLYLSDFFERNRTQYYDCLTRVREKNDLGGWLRFFFAGVIETAENSVKTFEKILQLRREIESERLPRIGKRAANGRFLLGFLFRSPVVNRKELQTFLDCSESTAGRLIADFVELGILREITGYSRNRRYVFGEYIDIFNK